MIIFETERCRVRRYLETDIGEFHRLNSDPEVMRYIRSTKTLSESRAFLKENIQFYDKYPLFGRWALVDKMTGIFLGSFAIIPYLSTGDWQLGYALHTASWGKGYASEATRGGIDYAFGKAGLQKILAITEVPNLPSQKVLIKNNFQFVKDYHSEGKLLRLYILLRSEAGG